MLWCRWWNASSDVILYDFQPRLIQWSIGSWAIPMATDIAFAMGVYGFFKNKMPAGVAAFLLTLATVDDLGAILVNRYLLLKDFNQRICFSCCSCIRTDVCCVQKKGHKY